MTPVDPELTRMRRAFAALSEAEDLGSGCPSAERLWAAVRGELSGPEVEPLVEHIAACGACAEVWRLAADVEPRSAPAVVPFPAPTSGWRPAIGIAAMLAVVTTGVFVASRATREPQMVTGGARPADTNARPANDAAPAPTPAIPGVLEMDKPAVKISARHALLFRGETNANDSFLADSAGAFTAYKGDRYEDAAKQFDELARKYPHAAEPLFYRGVSLLMLDRAGDAIEPLKEARPLADGELVRDAEWYLVLAYHHAGQVDQARAALRPICAATGAYAARACAALRELTPR
jgi:hypothetical protein